MATSGDWSPFAPIDAKQKKGKTVKKWDLESGKSVWLIGLAPK